MHGIGAGMRNFKGETALLQACKAGNVECAYRLLEEYMDSPDVELLINQPSGEPTRTHCTVLVFKQNFALEKCCRDSHCCWG
jgi:hypothetical protein